MKEIKLIPDEPFHNYVEVSVCDFPKGLDESPRQRCKITVEFAEYDVNQLKKQGLDLAGALDYYENWIYGVIKYHLAQDWTPTEGYDKVMEIVRGKLGMYY